MPYFAHRWLLAAGMLLAFAAFARADNPPASETVEDEKLLQAAKVPVDGAGLLEFFKKRTLADSAHDKITGLIQQLGHDYFPVRHKATNDLIALGQPVLSQLRRALSHPDEEVRQRARDCIEAIQRGPSSAVTAAAVRMVKARKPAGATAVLLAYLPFADDEVVEEEVLVALVGLGVTDGKVDTALIAALKDKTAARRAAAGLIVGRSGTAEQRNAVQPLLTDADPGVRFRAAQGLLAGRDRSGIPALIALLTEGPLDLAGQAEDLLICAAGTKAPRTVLAEDAASRRRCRDAWNGWWNTLGKKIDLTKADVDLPWLNPTQRVREVSRQFLNAVFRGDAVTFRRTTDAPFFLVGEMTLATRAELDRFFLNEIRAEMRGIKFTFTITKIVGLDEYIKTAHDREKEFLSKLRKAEMRVVYVQMREGERQREEQGTLFVRAVGGRVHVIGVGDK